MSWLRGASSPEDQFASEVIALVREILGLKAERLDGFALRIERPDGQPVTMNLQNVYAEAQQLDGAARAERLCRAVLAVVPPPRPASWRDAAPLLMPAVRTASWANAMTGPARAGAPAGVPFGQPLVPFVKVLCAIDAEHSMSFATAADLAAWGVPDEEALRAASANLARMPCEDVHVAKYTLMQRPDASFWSWASWVRQVTNGLLPRADVLVFGDTENPGAQLAVRWDDVLRIAGRRLADVSAGRSRRQAPHPGPNRRATAAGPEGRASDLC
jgi:hypothetical protein